MFNLIRFIQTILEEAREQRHREREVMAIARLDDRLLHDIGLNRGDVDRMVFETFGPKPFKLLEGGIALSRTSPIALMPAGYRLQH